MSTLTRITLGRLAPAAVVTTGASYVGALAAAEVSVEVEALSLSSELQAAQLEIELCEWSAGTLSEAEIGHLTLEVVP